MENVWHLSKIPKVLHLYWGSEKLSYLRFLTVLSFRKQNPDWQIKVHRPKFPYIGHITWDNLSHSYKGLSVGVVDYLDELKEHRVEFVFHDFESYEFKNDIPESYKSDYLKYEILSSEGGVWSDFDIFYIKSMNSISINNQENCDLDFGVYFFGNSIAKNFTLSFPANPFCAKQKYWAKRKLDLSNYNSISTDLQSWDLNPFNFPMKINCFSIDTIYSLDCNNTNNIFLKDIKVPSESIGVHWNASSLLGQKFNELVTSKNVAYLNNTLSNLILESHSVENKKFVSIIIPSLRRSEQLKWNLYSLAQQKVDFDFEVIVLNDGFEDETINICRIFSRVLNIRHIFTGQRNSGSLSRKLKPRNPKEVIEIGLKESIGDIVFLSNAEIFLSDENTLSEMVRACQHNPDHIVIPRIIDDLDGSVLFELNDNYGSISNNNNNKQVIIFREPCDYKFYFAASKKDNFKRKDVVIFNKSDLDVIHLYHGESTSKKTYLIT